MKKIIFRRRDLIAVLIMFIVGLILTYFGMVIVGNTPETFNDFIVETVAWRGGNITGELKVFWVVLLLGVPGLMWIRYWLKGIKDGKDKRSEVFILRAELVLAIANVIFLLTTGGVQLCVSLVMIVVFLNYVVNPTKQKEGLVLDLVLYFAMLGLLTALNWVGVKFEINGLVIMMVAAAIGLIVLAIANKRDIIKKIVLILETIVPLCLLSYVVERYSLGGEIIRVNYPMIVRLGFFGVILAMMGWSIYRAIKEWKKPVSEGWNAELSVAVLSVIFIANSIGTNTGLVVPTDLHHTAEEVISYQQIIGRGQEAYVAYSPVSGLFPMFIGGVLEAVGGNITEFEIAHAIFMMMMAGLTMWVIAKHLDRIDALIVGMCFAFVSYDRAVWILLSLLVLFLPKLIMNRNLWLKVWILLILVHGIYYPSFGGALLVGTLPMGIWQAVRLVRDGELKQLVRKWGFYVGWLVVFGIVGLCVPLLLRMAQHVMIYSSQTNLADGIAVFGQRAPEGFMPYLVGGGLELVRYMIYYALRYVIPMMVVWIMVIVLVKFWKRRNVGSDNMVGFFWALAGVIVLLVAYVSTMVRQDEGAIVSRATYVIIPIFGVVMYIIMKKYFGNSLCNTIVIGIAVGVSLILGCCPITKMTQETVYARKLSDNYVLIDENLNAELPRLGKGFITKDDIGMFMSYKERADKLLAVDDGLKFLGWGKLGVYYTLDLTTVGQPSLYAAKDYKTHMEIIDAIKEQKPVVGKDLSDPILNYYLYNWLLTSGEYLYDAELDAFLPKELYAKMYYEDKSKNTGDEVEVFSTDAGRVASALGASLGTLERNMENSNVEYELNNKGCDTVKRECRYEVKFGNDVYGDDADMMYIDFDVTGWLYEAENSSGIMAKLAKQNYNDGVYVIVSWGSKDNQRMTSVMGRGDLLIPLGANSSWLLEQHDAVTIVIKNVDEQIKINEIEYYKLREIE